MAIADVKLIHIKVVLPTKNAISVMIKDNGKKMIKGSANRTFLFFASSSTRTMLASTYFGPSMYSSSSIGVGYNVPKLCTVGQNGGA